MSILNKRLIACFVDYFIMISIILPITFLELPTWFWSIDINALGMPLQIPSLGVAFLVTMISCKDIMFKNASFGKKLMKLEIVNTDGTVPTCRTIIKRAFLMQTVGYIHFFTTSPKEQIVDWEASKLHTKVIERYN